VVYISTNSKINTYKRIVYSYLVMLGFMGGIAELIIAAGHLLIFFTKRSYYSWMLNKLYQVESNCHDESDSNVSDNQVGTKLQKSFKTRITSLIKSKMI